MHSTKMPGVVAEGVKPDCSVEETAVMSTNPSGSPPLHVIVSGVLRGIGLPVTLASLVQLNCCTLDGTVMLADSAPTFAPPGPVTVKVPGTIPYVHELDPHPVELRKNGSMP